MDLHIHLIYHLFAKSAHPRTSKKRAGLSRNPARSFCEV
jgi:hypothetical protein